MFNNSMNRGHNGFDCQLASYVTDWRQSDQFAYVLMRLWPLAGQGVIWERNSKSEHS